MIVTILVTAFLSDAIAAASRKQPKSESEKVEEKGAIEWLQNSFMKTTYNIFVSKPHGDDGKTFSMTTLPLRFEEVRQCVFVMDTKVEFSGSITGSQFWSREVDFGTFNPNVGVPPPKRRSVEPTAGLDFGGESWAWKAKPCPKLS